MNHPDYVAPDSLEELLSELHHHPGKAKIIAGGTDLIPQMRAGRASPKILIDPLKLPLKGITPAPGQLCLGAALTHTQITNSDLLKQRFPALVSACQEIGGPPVRNRGTLAGNLANASPAADTAPPLLVYDAQLRLVKEGRERKIPLTDFFLGPGRTRLEEDELIREVCLPAVSDQTGSVFIKLGKRQGMAIAVVSVAVRLVLDPDRRVSTARIALGAVGPTPFRAKKAEKSLETRKIEEKAIQEAAWLASQASAPISDVRASADYRRKMVIVLVRRALETAWDQLNDRGGHE